MRRARRDVGAAPFIVIWEATRACPLACLHCRAEARPDRHPGELSTHEARELMRQVAAFGRPAPLFVITGGDPFERPDLFDLVRYGRELGLAPSVSPSATPALTPPPTSAGCTKPARPRSRSAWTRPRPPATTSSAATTACSPAPWPPGGRRAKLGSRCRSTPR
ncbi:radical SAM protein [Nonomuraea ferruginea]